MSATDGTDRAPRPSRALLEGPERAAARAYLKGIGYDDDALARPIVGIANTWTETMPCNFHLRRLAERVKDGVRAAGGTPMEFNTVAISDGITMGTEGMKTSLVSREVIADSIELVARGHAFDAIVALSGCDKTIPGCVMALARLDRPSVMLYGGTIAPGRFRDRDVTIQDVFEGVGAHAAGRMSEAELTELENRASPGAGACAGQFTANTMGMAFEVLGISPMGSSMVPAEDGKKGAVAEDCGRLALELLERDLRPSAVITKPSLENAIAGAAMSGGSTNVVLHLLAVAREAGVELTIDDFDRIAWSTPLLADLKPGGRYVATDLYRAGGVPLVVKRLREAGLLHAEAPTVTGHTLGEMADLARETEGQQVIHALDDPLKANGGFAILRGSLAPEGCVVKLSGHDRLEHRGPARVFESEEDAFAASRPGRSSPATWSPSATRVRRAVRACARCSRSRPRWSARASATRSPCSPTAASRGPRTASWPRTSPRRPPEAGRSPRCRTATRSSSTWPPASSTSSSPRRRSASGSPPTARPRPPTAPACWPSTRARSARPRRARSQAEASARPPGAGAQADATSGARKAGSPAAPGPVSTTNSIR